MREHAREYAVGLLVGAARELLLAIEADGVRAENYSAIRDAVVLFDLAGEHDEAAAISARADAPFDLHAPEFAEVRKLFEMLAPPRGAPNAIPFPHLIATSGVRFEGFPVGPYHIDLFLDRRTSELEVRFLPEVPGFSEWGPRARIAEARKSEKRRRRAPRK